MVPSCLNQPILTPGQVFLVAQMDQVSIRALYSVHRCWPCWLTEFNNNDESAYREEVEQLAEWCRSNNLFLFMLTKNKETTKTKEIKWTIHHCTSNVQRPRSFMVCREQTEILSWTLNTAFLAEKAQQWLDFLWRLKRDNLSLPSSQSSIEGEKRTSWPAVSHLRRQHSLTVIGLGHLSASQEKKNLEKALVIKSIVCCTAWSKRTLWYSFKLSMSTQFNLFPL